nr:retrovirus-related Pol polyprotein from transposon TNT 1-94 [Tanacetum cinerariifolium]
AQKNRGTLAVLSIVRAASTSVRFRLSKTPFCSGVRATDICSNNSYLSLKSSMDKPEEINENFRDAENLDKMKEKETYAKNDQVADEEFINIFCTPVQNQGETSSRNVDSSNMHTFYQRYPSEHRWTKDHPLEQVIGNPSQSVRTRRQLESDAEICMFTLTVSRTEPKNIKEAMVDSAWIESMQEKLHQFDRLDAQPTEKHLTAVKRIFDSDHAGCLDSRKSTSGGIQFLGGDKLVSWSSKKQDCTSMSFAEAEYVSLSACYTQVLWMRTQLTDYGFHFDKIPTYCDSKEAVSISCNPVQHSRTKHIDVRYHFIKEKVEKGIVELFFVGTKYQLADLFTKALPVERFQYLVRRLEAEYVSLSTCCAQVLWMRTQLTDYGFHFDKIPMYCDTKAAIAISCNPVQHSRTKHIDVRYHFIKEKVEMGIFELFFVGTDYQLADLFTKALLEERFKYLVRRLSMRYLTPTELEALANESA